MSTVKASRKKTLKYDLFLSYAKLEVSPHWRKLFEDCAFGTFPKGISYKDGVVYCKKAKKKPTTFVFCDAVDRAIQGFKQFLKQELGEISIDEMTKKRLNLEVAMRNNTMPKDMQWADIRAPTVKQQLITLFVSDMKDSLNLSDQEAQNLKVVLKAGLGCKRITSEHIRLENHKIVSIEGIDMDESGFFLTTKLEPAPKILRRQPESREGQTSCSEGWEKRVASYIAFIGIAT